MWTSVHPRVASVHGVWWPHDAREGIAEQYVSVGGHRLRAHQPRQGALPRDRHHQGRGHRLLLAGRRRACIPHARDRPATRKRWVHGVGTAEKPGQVFFEKNLPDSAPDWIATRDDPALRPRRTPTRSSTTSPTLVWLAQMAALELHVPQWRFGRNGARKNPDRMVLDLDPGEGAGLPECVEVAQARARAPAGTWGSTRCRSRAAARASTCTPRSTARRPATRSRRSRTSSRGRSRPIIPDLVVSDMKKALRGGKVLLDWSQNNGSKTTIVPYSLRGRLAPDGRRAAHLARARLARPARSSSSTRC